VVKSRVSAGFKEKIFNTDFPGLVLYIEEIEPGGGTLKGILISDARNPQNKNTVIAKVGLLVPNEASKTVTLRLLDGTIYGVGGSADSFQKTDFTIYDVSLALTNFGEMRPKEKDPKEMSLGELRDAIDKAGVTGKEANEEEIELHRKFSIPFACYVFMLVGVPLAIPPSRAVRSRGFSMSLALIFLYYVPLTVGQTLADKGIVPAMVGLWLPNAGFLTLGVFLFRSAAREEPVWLFEQVELLGNRAVAYGREVLRKMVGA
jgi:lipopolysaccharide export system permease protein